MARGGHIDKNEKAPYTKHERTISFLVPRAAFGYRKDTLLGTKGNIANCVCDLQRIFYAGNSLFFLEIHKVFLRKTAFFHRKISS